MKLIPNHPYKISVLFILSIVLACCQAKKTKTSGWEKAKMIKENLPSPSFPNEEYSILDFGALPNDSSTNSLTAIKEAFTACNKNGGGKVKIPKGTYYLEGPIHFKSNVNLHLENGAILKFSTDPNDYLPLVHTRFEGLELLNYSPLIYANDKKNIAITGNGVLDGQADKNHWWPWKGNEKYGWEKGMPSQNDSLNRPELSRMSDNQAPLEKRKFGKGHYLRPAFIETYKSKNIYFQGITVKNSPFWIFHPILSKNIIADSITLKSFGPNNDGFNPESSENVLIKNSTFRNGDDCIAIKNGRDEDGRRINIPAKNIIIENNKMQEGHGGITIGSEVSGNVRNIFAKNNKMNSPDQT